MDGFRAMTLRLPVPLADDLALVSAVEGWSQAEITRRALAEYIDRKKASVRFHAALEAYVAKAARMIPGEDQ